MTEVEESARIECHTLKGVIIDSISGNDEETSVRAMIVRSPSPKHLLLKFHRRSDRWLLTECTLAERAAAREIISDPARWNALPFDEPELLDTDLALALASFVSLTGGAAGSAARSASAALGKLAALRGDAATRSLAATCEAVVAEAGGEIARAKQRGADAVALARESGDPQVLTRALMIQSRAFERSPNGSAQALAAMEEALAVADRVPNRQLVAYVMGNTGNLNLKQGNYAKALLYFERAAAISKQIGDTAGLMKVESAEGLLLQIESDHQLAIVHMLRANELGEGDPANDAWRGQNFISLAQSYTALGRDRESMDALRKAEELGKRSKAPIVVGETHRLLGSSHRRAHDYAAATRELEQALAVFEAAKRIHFIPTAMSELALTRLEAGDLRGAVEQADRCAKASLETDQVLPFVECRTLSGEARNALGETGAALGDLRSAIDASEERRRGIVGDARQRAHFLERVISPYLYAADILAGRGEVAPALELVEQARSRALLGHGSV